VFAATLVVVFYEMGDSLMRGLIYLLGAIAMIVAFGFLAFWVVPAIVPIDGIPAVTNLYERVLCDSSPTNPQTLSVVREQSIIDDNSEMDGGTAFNAILSCTDSENRTVDVSGKNALIGGAGFAAFLTLSIVLWIIPSAISEAVDVVRGGKETVQAVASVPSEWANAVQSLFSDPKPVSATNDPTYDPATDSTYALASRQSTMESLNTLYERNLISKQAYEAAREQLLKG
jgi:hypothetical protein